MEFYKDNVCELLGIEIPEELKKRKKDIVAAYSSAGFFLKVPFKGELGEVMKAYKRKNRADPTAEMPSEGIYFIGGFNIKIKENGGCVELYTPKNLLGEKEVEAVNTFLKVLNTKESSS